MKDDTFKRIEAQHEHSEKGEPPFCSFCGLGSNQVKIMIEGPSATYICGACVAAATKMVDKEKS